VSQNYRIAEIFGVSYTTLLSLSTSPQQIINIHNGENQIFNGPQINTQIKNYTDKELLTAVGDSIETMHRVMDWYTSRRGERKI